jgi:hypothetical protein
LEKEYWDQKIDWDERERKGRRDGWEGRIRR